MGYGSLDPRRLRQLQREEKLRAYRAQHGEPEQLAPAATAHDAPPILRTDVLPFCDAWGDLCSLLEIRGFFLNKCEGRGYSLTLKVTLKSGARAYRFGYLRHPSEVPHVLDEWLEAGYWTPDRQAP